MLPIIKMITSHRDHDCALVALAMLTGKDYEDIVLAASQIDKRAGKRGLYSSQIRKIAELLGITLRLKRKFDPEAASGILDVQFHNGEKHALLLDEGRVFDSNGDIWAIDAYLTTQKSKIGHLLEVV